MKRFWLSWTVRPTDGPFTLHSPWWVSGSAIEIDDKGKAKAFDTICAAVQAESLDEAKGKILSGFDSRLIDLAWSFAGKKPDNWSPWDVKHPGNQTRFPRAKWMEWPEV